MARLSRLAISGCVHHVLQRGIDHRPIFRDEADLRRMQEILGDVGREHGLALHAYVLMPDHFHLVLTPDEAGALSSGMQSLGRRYVRGFNQRHQRSGPLWEGRFRSTILEPERLLIDCMRYVEFNPVRARIVSEASTYPWSSMQHHLGLRVDPLLSDHAQFWAMGNTPFERQAAFAQVSSIPLDERALALFRSATVRGWPLGTDEFLEALGRKTSRRLVRNPIGRPRRQEQTTAK